MFSSNTKIRDILAEEDFALFREFLFPAMFVQHKLMRMLPLKVFDRVWSVESIVNGFQYIKDLRRQGKTLFYPLYREEDAYRDVSLRQRILFHFPVEEKKKFAVICAGGGYESVCSFVEAYPVAQALNRMGYHAFVVNYRVGQDAHFPNPMDDLAHAVSCILQRAEEFGIDAQGYAVMGFSAGGHLAASFGTKSLGYEKYGLPKPGALILAYPVITMGKYTHRGSRLRLLGKDHMYDTGYQERYSVEKQVTPDYPPVYIWQCEADNTVPIQNSKMLSEALERCKVGYRYHVYPGSAHGWELAVGKSAEGWLAEAVDFWEEVC